MNHIRPISAELTNGHFATGFANDPLPIIQFNRAESDRGSVSNLTTPDNDKRTLYLDRALSQHKTLGKAFVQADTIVAQEAQRLVAQQTNGYHGAAFNTEQTRSFTTIKPPVVATIQVVRDFRRDHNKRLIRSLQFNRDSEPSAALRSDLRQWLLSNAPAQRMALLIDADYTLAVSALEIGRVPLGLDETQWSKFCDVAGRVIFIHQTGLESDYTRKPSLQLITAAGIDTDRLNKAADERVKELHRDTDVLELAEAYLQAVVSFVALLCNASAEELLP